MVPLPLAYGGSLKVCNSNGLFSKVRCIFLDVLLKVQTFKHKTVDHLWKSSQVVALGDANFKSHYLWKQHLQNLLRKSEEYFLTTLYCN